MALPDIVLILLRCLFRAHYSLRYALTRGLLVMVTLLSTIAAADPDSVSSSDSDEVIDCLIHPWIISDIGSPVQGIVAELLVERGDRVSRGQAVARLEAEVESAEVLLAEARSVVDSELVAREAEFKLAEMELKRAEELHQKKMGSAQVLDEATARFQIARAALHQALQNKQIQQLEVTRSKRHAARRTLSSPIDGIVVEHLTFAGEFVYDNAVMTVAALDPLRVEVIMPGRLYGTVAPGDKARLHTEFDKDSALVAVVDVVDAMLDPRSGTFGVRLKLDNADQAIPAGQRCQVEFGPEIAAASPEDSEVTAEPAER